MRSKVGLVTGIFGKDDLKNVRNELNLLLPDFLLAGLERLTLGEVLEGKAVWAVPGVPAGKGAFGFPWFAELHSVGWASPLNSISSCCGQLKAGNNPVVATGKVRDNLRGLLYFQQFLVLQEDSGIASSTKVLLSSCPSLFPATFWIWLKRSRCQERGSASPR